MRAHFTLMALCAVILCGCAHKGYVEGNGDLGQFILKQAIAYGGHPTVTNGLPAITTDWRYVEDEFGIGIEFKKEEYSLVENYLCRAFGARPSSAGWPVRNIGVAIYLPKNSGDSNGLLSINPTMSEGEHSMAFKKMADTVSKNLAQQP